MYKKFFFSCVCRKKMESGKVWEKKNMENSFALFLFISFSVERNALILIKFYKHIEFFSFFLFVYMLKRLFMVSFLELFFLLFLIEMFFYLAHSFFFFLKNCFIRSVKENAERVRQVDGNSIISMATKANYVLPTPQLSCSSIK